MKTLLKKITIATVVLASASVFAIQRPTEFVSHLVNKVKNEVATKHLTLKSNPKIMYAMVKKTVMPEVAVEQMAGMTVGPRWRSATKVQRQEFVAQFSQLLTRNYSAALLAVADYNYKVYPLRGKAWEKETQVNVNGAIVPKDGGKGSSVTYYLERTGDNWKVYDFAVEGVSFVNNFRSQFASFTNMKDLIAALKKLNNRDKS